MREIDFRDCAITLEAVKAAGGPSVVAKKLGISRQAVAMWYLDSGRIPVEWVRQVERLSGISRAALRPDIYDDEPPDG